MDSKGDAVNPVVAGQIAGSGSSGVLSVDGTRLHDMLSATDRTALSAIGSVDTVPNADMPIFREGDQARNLYAISSGIVRICRHLDNLERQVLSFLWPGDIFGLVGDDGRYLNSASTVSPAKIHRFPLNRLEPLLRRNPQLQCHLLIKANHDLRAAQRQIFTLGHIDTYRRLASFLVEMMQHSALVKPESRRLRLPMARRDIADYLGTTPETVSRGFQRMEREGILRRVSPRVLEFEDLSGLSHLARR